MINNKQKLMTLSFCAIVYGSAMGSMNQFKPMGLPSSPFSLIWGSPSLKYDHMMSTEFKDASVRNFLYEVQPPKKELLYFITEQNKWTEDQKRKFNYDPDYFNVFEDKPEREFYLKGRFPLSRVICARRMKNIIETEKYSTISVPDKYLFLSNSRKYVVCAAKKVVSTDEKEVVIELNQIREFAEMVFKTRFCDWHDGNFMIDKDKKIVFIDTDVKSFSMGGRYAHHNLEQMKKFLIPEDGSKCKMHNTTVTLTPEAQSYLSDQIAHHGENLQTTYRSLTQKTEYDTKDFNIPFIYESLWNKCRAKEPIDSYIR